GSEEIKGFGLTLGIGLATSLFTSLFVTRQHFNVMIPATLNADEIRKCWVRIGLLGALAGACLGLARLANAPEDLRDSRVYGLGIMLLWMLGTALTLMASLSGFH